MSSLRKYLKVLPDKPYIQLMYFKHYHKFCNFSNPKTFNEKLQWLKLNDRREEYTVMVDKYLAKDYVRNIIGDKYIIPLVGAWDSADDIDFDSLPDKFVLKWNHDSGSIVICNDKSKLDKETAKNKLRGGANHSGYWYGREWPYKNVHPKLIAEEYMEDAEGKGELTDYKIFCFNGEPMAIQVMSNRFGAGGTKSDLFTKDWKNYGVKRGSYVISDNTIEKPAELEEILNLSRRLSEGIPFIRVDFYIVNHKVYFGELTLYPASGFSPFDPSSFDDMFGEWIDLNLAKKTN